jgi:hypothetical protein
MEEQTIEFNGIEVVITKGKDGIPLVCINSKEIPEGENGPKMRIRLNDEKIWDDKEGIVLSDW